MTGVGGVGVAVATGAAFSPWPLLAAAVVVYAAGTTMRTRIEERLLRQTFGTEYGDYARRVPSLLPRLRRRP